jgi:hypothetical protein
MIGSPLTEVARQLIPKLERLIRIDEISVPDAARLLRKKPEWIRQNFPVIYHSPKSHYVRLADIEAYQARRTVWPKWLRNGAE